MIFLRSEPLWRTKSEHATLTLTDEGRKRGALDRGEYHAARKLALQGRQPRVANMLVEDYLRPAAVEAGVLKEGEKVRFGFHNLRHSLASFLVRKGTDVKTVQKLLRHSDVATTLGICAQSMSEDGLAAQEDMLAAMMPKSNAVN